ncbi:MAG: prefoldin subunit alpha [Thermoplasmata archaeon]|nr:prefoldin subunit alpha [Thermoplasmata archaeon]
MTPAMSSPPREEEVQEGLVRLDAFRGQLNAMLQQHQYLTSSRVEHVRARESLEGFDRTGDAAELLVPLGAETFVRGQPIRSQSVLIGIGSGLVVEMERPKASELLAQRVVRIDEAVQELEGQIRGLEERINALSDRLDRMTRGGSPSGLGEAGDVVGH